MDSSGEQSVEEDAGRAQPLTSAQKLCTPPLPAVNDPGTLQWLQAI